jgi:GTP cyclohydrolase II
MNEKLGVSLFGEPDQVAVERAIAEFRAGRPVRIMGGGVSLAAMPVEGVQDEQLTAVSLSQPRIVTVSHLIGDSSADLEAVAVSLLPLTAATVLSLVQSRLPHRDATAAYTATTMSASEVEKSALKLTALSHLLPAALVWQPQDADRANMLTVEAQAISAFRDREAETIKIVSRAPVPLEGVSDCEFVVFRGGDGFRDQVAVIVGKPPLAEPVLVRLHSACLTGDLFGSLKCDCGEQLRGTVRAMAEQGGGIVLYLDQEGRGNGIANKIRAYALQAEGYDTYDADHRLGFGLDQRRFDFAAGMLYLLGYRSVRLMTNNPQKIEALRQAGLDVVSTQRVWTKPTAHNVKYLAAKRDKAGHLLGDAALDGMDAADLGPMSASRQQA